MTYNNYSSLMNCCVSTFPIAFSLIFVALILTLSIAALDERIALYPHQPSLWYVNTYTLVHSTPSVSHYRKFEHVHHYAIAGLMYSLRSIPLPHLLQPYHFPLHTPTLSSPSSTSLAATSLVPGSPLGLLWP